MFSQVCVSVRGGGGTYHHPIILPLPLFPCPFWGGVPPSPSHNSSTGHKSLGDTPSRIWMRAPLPPSGTDGGNPLGSGWGYPPIRDWMALEQVMARAVRLLRFPAGLSCFCLFRKEFFGGSTQTVITGAGVLLWRFCRKSLTLSCSIIVNFGQRTSNLWVEDSYAVPKTCARNCVEIPRFIVNLNLMRRAKLKCFQYRKRKTGNCFGVAILSFYCKLTRCKFCTPNR